MKKKKFSQFEFPKNPADIYLVGYEVGTGEEGENTSIQVKASDLAFSVSGAAGVSSVNGISGSVFLNAGDGVQLTQTGNGITISASSDIETDDIFNAESTNPQSGVAISNELTKYANLETSNIFSGDVQMNKVNITKQLRVNAPATFNDEVTISGRNISEAVVNSASHIASTDLHLTSEKSAIIALADSHIENETAHVTAEEKAMWNQVNKKADIADFYGSTYATLETVPTGGGDEWDACRISAENVPHDFAIKYITFKALKENDIPLFLAVFRREGNNRSLIAVSENSNVYLSFSPLPFGSLLFIAIRKSSSDNHFAFLYFFFLGVVLITASCTMSQTSVHSFSGTLSIRSNPLNLFLTSTHANILVHMHKYFTDYLS